MTLDVYNYFLHQKTYNKLVGNDYLFVEYKCPIDSENFKLWTENNFITHIISGKKDWTALDKKYTTNSGDSLFIKKGVYNTKQYFEVDYCVMLFFITDDFIRRFCEENKNLISNNTSETCEDQILEINGNDSLNSLFTTVFTYLNQGGDIPKDLVEIKFKELLFNIVMNPANKKLVSYFKSLKQIEKTNLRDVMMKNFHSDLKLEDYARLSGRSLSTFKRDFQNHFDQTPGKWLNDKRLQYAKTLLENTELNINEICFESGFKNPSHFNRSFKDKYQYPPNQYRRMKSIH